MIDTGSTDAVEDICVFWEIVAGRIPSDKVAEDANTLAFMDIDPGADGHLLVIPKHHSVDLLSVPTEDLVQVTRHCCSPTRSSDRSPGGAVSEYEVRGRSRCSPAESAEAPGRGASSRSGVEGRARHRGRSISPHCHRRADSVHAPVLRVAALR
ncbi:HIT domain-containing protein [Microbacterium aerolatum]|uniref:HIT domain-containing protein n=1 Tax=Microbacterium aerolatum TaxID=153731 RepID=UPI00384AC10F